MSEELELSFDLEGNKASTGFSGRKFDRLKIEQDSTIHVRVMPPFGTNHNRMLFRKYSIHWGFTTEEGGKRPISCSYPTERFCPLCERVKEAENELESYKDKKSGKYVGGSPDRVKELQEYIKTFGVNNFFALNAVTIDGRAVILELKKTAVDELMARIDEAVKLRKFDPLSLDKGVWFEMSRTGKNFGTKYKVDFKKINSKTADGQDCEVRDHSAMPGDLVTAIKKQLVEQGTSGPLYDIHTLHDPVTAKEIQNYIEGEPLPTRKREVGAGETAAPTEEQGEVPQVSYATGAPEPENPTVLTSPKAAAKAAAAPPTAAKLSPPPANASAAKPAMPSAAAEIARLRSLANSSRQASSPKAGG
jgi:hypothetical protein